MRRCGAYSKKSVNYFNNKSAPGGGRIEKREQSADIVACYHWRLYFSAP
jgi:hypothetical protein